MKEPSRERRQSLKEMVLDYAKRHFPDALEGLQKTEHIDTEELERRRQRHAIIEQIALKKEFSELSDQELALAGLERREDGFYQLLITDHFQDKRLPEGYRYKGGAARSLLQRNLGLLTPTASAHPRDIDIIRLVPDEPSPGLDQQLAQEYMPDDLENGHSVEYIDAEATYLNSRDFTINELYATDKHIVATDACLRDTIRGIIRVTDYDYRQYGSIGPKMLSKMLRFYAEALSKGLSVKMEYKAQRTLDEFSLPLFWIGLNLDRSLELGMDTAKEYVHQLHQYNQIPAELETVEEVVEWMRKQLEPRNFYFRFAPNSDYLREEEWVE